MAISKHGIVVIDVHFRQLAAVVQKTDSNLLIQLHDKFPSFFFEFLKTCIIGATLVLLVVTVVLLLFVVKCWKC